MSGSSTTGFGGHQLCAAADTLEIPALLCTEGWRRFLLLERISEGGHGAVIKAMDFDTAVAMGVITLDQGRNPPWDPGLYPCRNDSETRAVIATLLKNRELLVAMKLLKTWDIPGEYLQEMTARMQREARILTGIKSQHLPHFAGGLWYGPIPGFTMELLFGETLDVRIQALLAKGYVPWRLISGLLGDLLRVMTVLDEGHRLVHRDLKPENIMLVKEDGGGEVMKLIDLGVVRQRANELQVEGTAMQVPGREGRADVAGITTAASPKAITPCSAAPEQWETLNVTPAADVYAIGTIVHEMAYGQPFLPVTNDWDAIRAAHNRQVGTLRHPDLGARANAALQALIQDMLWKDAERRIQRPREAHDRLREVRRIHMVEQGH